MDTRQMENRKNTITTFQDLIVYQNLYKVMKLVLQKIVPKLPKEEKYDLADQLRRASKAAPALLAEGFAKRYQKRQWRKYLNDTAGECNEMIHHLSVCLDIYPQNLDKNTCKQAIEIYNLTCKQLTKLGQAWQNYHESK